jgi:hypothetical protein
VAALKSEGRNPKAERSPKPEILKDPERMIGLLLGSAFLIF